MLKKTIKYVDYNGIERTEDFYFNLSKTELAQMQFREEGDLAERVRGIVKAKNRPAIMQLFDSFIIDSYGEKSEDGRHFIKVRNGHRLADDFIASPAYDVLYFELINDPEKFADFINHLVPPDLAAELAKMEKSGELDKTMSEMM